MEKLKGSARAVALAQIAASLNDANPFHHPFFGPPNSYSFEYFHSRDRKADFYYELEKAEELLTQAEKLVEKRESAMPVIDFQTERKHEL